MDRDLHPLRFAAWFWESNWVRRSGCYTNRLMPSELLDLFRRAGLAAEVIEDSRRDSLPIPRRRLDPSFRAFGDEDLLVESFHVRLRPIPPPSSCFVANRCAPVVSEHARR
jgi:hypothetical protein